MGLSFDSRRLHNNSSTLDPETGLGAQPVPEGRPDPLGDFGRPARAAIIAHVDRRRRDRDGYQVAGLSLLVLFATIVTIGAIALARGAQVHDDVRATRAVVERCR